MQSKSLFRNATSGQVGVVTIEPGGKERGIAVAPGGEVWLSEDEQVVTANAPRKDEDNPFRNGQLELVEEASNVKNRRPIGTDPVEEPAASGSPEQPSQSGEGEPADAPVEGDPAAGPANARQEANEKRAAEERERAEKAAKQAQAGPVPAEETGSAVSPQGTPKVGKRAPGEEVGVPDAPAAAPKPS